MRESVPTARYSPVCNVLLQWKTSLILTYHRVDRQPKTPTSTATIIIINSYSIVYVFTYNNFKKIRVYGSTAGIMLFRSLAQYYFVGEQGPADGRWIRSQPFTTSNILRRHRTQTQSILVTRSASLLSCKLRFAIYIYIYIFSYVRQNFDLRKYFTGGERRCPRSPKTLLPFFLRLRDRTTTTECPSQVIVVLYIFTTYT